MKKLLFILILIVLFLSILNIKNSQEDNKTVFWTLQLSTFDKYINNVIAAFNKDKVKWIDVPYSEGEKRTLAAILSDNPPALINITPDFTILLAQKNALEEIPIEKLDDYNLTEALKYNGKYYGIPFYATSAVTLFNKSLMPNIKKIPETYDELLMLKPPKGVYTTMISFSENDTLLKILNKYNINSPQNIDSEKSIELFSLFKYAYNNGYIPVESVTQTHREALEKYMSGQLVFLVTGANFINMIKENAPSIYKNTIILPQITGSTGIYDFSLMNFIIPKKAKNKQTAMDFAFYLTNPENQLEFSKLTSVLPVNKKTLENNFFKIYDNNDKQAQARIISAKQMYKMQPPIKNTRRKKDINLLTTETIQRILINNADIKETLYKLKNDWQNLED